MATEDVTPVDTGDEAVESSVPTTVEEAEADPDWEAIGQWQFIDRLPSDEEVLDLLATLKDVWGVSFGDFAEYIIPLPNSTKTKVDRPRPDGNGMQRVEETHEVVTLYFSVAGRIQMLNRAQMDNGWRVDIDPEPTVLGPPGYLKGMEPDAEGAILYRSIISIWDDTDRFLGRRTGQATGRGDRPHEKAETAANGRAAAAWGFGVIPGSGIASIEEMRATSGARQALQADRSARTATRSGRRTRAEMDEELLTVMEQVRQLRGQDRTEMIEKVDDYVRATFSKSIVSGADDEGLPILDLSVLKDGQVMLVTTQFETIRRKTETEQQPV